MKLRSKLTNTCLLLFKKFVCVKFIYSSQEKSYEGYTNIVSIKIEENEIDSLNILHKVTSLGNGETIFEPKFSGFLKSQIPTLRKDLC